jgi:outer membrane protein assembly factor BamD (BamD/ComL family)
MNALYNSGVVYMNDLKDYGASNGQFEELLAEYPGNVHTLPSYYNLYTNYNELDNAPKAESYKSAIINEFPESEIAQYMTNPDFIKEMEARQNEENLFYKNVYRKYRNEQYNEVITDVGTALGKFPDSDLVPRYKFLRVMSIGATSDIMTFSLALDSFVKEYPHDDIGRNAQIILSHVKEFNPEVKEETQKIEAEEIYHFDTASVYYFGMIASGIIDVNQLKFEIINFNLDYYAQTDFEVVSERVDRNDHLVLVKSFETMEQALQYLDSISLASNVYDLLGETVYHRFIISEENSQTLINDKISSKYLLFYEKHYLAAGEEEKD